MWVRMDKVFLLRTPHTCPLGKIWLHAWVV